MTALQAHAGRRYVDIDAMQFAKAPQYGTIAVIRQLFDELGLGGLFARIEADTGLAFTLGDAVFAMVAGRLVHPSSKRQTHRWMGRQVVAPEGFELPEPGPVLPGA